MAALEETLGGESIVDILADLLGGTCVRSMVLEATFSGNIVGLESGLRR